ncbi:MAG: hypothetical protein HY319_29130 [Armatimonadetes bacterium]|nr:hypothetical protein [Armatimonadota bacterium]
MIQHTSPALKANGETPIRRQGQSLPPGVGATEDQVLLTGSGGAPSGAPPIVQMGFLPPIEGSASSRPAAFGGLPPGVVVTRPQTGPKPQEASAADELPKKSGAWKKWAGLSLIGLAGIGVGMGLSGIDEAPPASQVADLEQTAPAPATSTAVKEDATFEWKLADLRVGDLPTIRTFGEHSSKVSVTTDRQVYTNGYFNLETQVDRLNLGKGRTFDASSDVNRAVEAFQYNGQSNWSAGTRIHPAGQAGPYVSARVDVGGYTPWAWANTFNQTFDVRSGERVTLTQLVGEEQFGKLLTQVRAAADDLGPGYEHNDSQLRNHVDNSFAVFQHKGETYLSVSIPGSAQQTQGTVAELAFKAPKLNE